MTYLQLAARLTSQLNGDPVPLSERKSNILFARYGVLDEAQKRVPGALVLRSFMALARPQAMARDKKKALNEILQLVFKNAGENYPQDITFDEVLELGRAVVKGLREG
jgi:hypothetical protein